MMEPRSRQEGSWNLTLQDDRAVLLRGLQDSDGPLLEEFYGSLPPEDLRHMDRNPRCPGVIRDWLEERTSQETLHLLAMGEADLVVGHCLVRHPHRGWKAHQGNLSVVVRPGWRLQGLAGALIERVVQLSLQAGLDLLVAELTPGLSSACSTFTRQGFHHRVTVPRFVRDAEGRDLDLMVLTREIREQEYFAGD